MNTISKKIFRLLPEALRMHLIRSNITVPNGVDNIVLKIASTKLELEQAYKLLHDSYVGQGLMDTHVSRMRFNIWLALPYTSVIIAKINDEVVGTVSLIMDSPVSLPADKIYKQENDLFRKNGNRLVEASAFAVNPKYRNSGHKISLYLMKYLYQYSKNHLHADMLCATVRTSAIDFYKALFAFKQTGKNIPHTFVKGAEVGHISMSLKDEHALLVQELYQNYSDSSNLFKFCTSPEPKDKFQFPIKVSEFTMGTAMSPETLEYFLVQKTALYKELTFRELKMIYSAYNQPEILVKSIPELKLKEINNRPHFRHLTKINALYISENTTVMGTILDLSEGGAYFASTQNLPFSEDGILVFKLQGKKYVINCKTAWANKGETARLPAGVGLKLQQEIFELKKTLLNVSRDHYKMGA